MSRQLTRLLSPRGRIATAVVLGLLSVSLVSLVTPAADPVSREITLVARDMAFYLLEQTQAGPNPTLQLKVGERVRIVLRNQDPGIVHGFAIKPWNVSMTSRYDEDEVVSVLVRAPRRPGRYEYVCTPHSTMMAGVIEVVASDEGIRTDQRAAGRDQPSVGERLRVLLKTDR